jgi:DNA-binding MarR family transcriptional regulator/GNAT superfamily N-acetyltransferase
MSDVPAVVALIAAQEVCDTGRVSIDEADIVGDWQRPSYDLSTHTIGVFDGNRLVAYAELIDGDRANAAVHPDHRGRGIGTRLAGWTQSAARAGGAAAIGMSVPRGSAGDRLLETLGYAIRWESAARARPPQQDGLALAAAAKPGPIVSRVSDPGVLDERATSEGVLLARLGQRAMRRLRAAHAESGLTPRQFHLLGLLQDRGPLTQSELGTRMEIDPSTLVTLLNPLEVGGYLAREYHPKDRRRRVVTITPDGARHLARSAQAQRDAEDEIFSGLTAQQRAQLRRLLRALATTLSEGRAQSRG